MIGRGVFHNPFVFDGITDYGSLDKEERVKHLQRHINMFEKVWTIDHPINEKEITRIPPT